jgi:hypothetical protein
LSQAFIIQVSPISRSQCEQCMLHKFEIRNFIWKKYDYTPLYNINI